MSPYSINRRVIAIICAIVISTAISTACFAQAYQGQVAFLEEFATRLYERGDYAGAMKEFERIARLDPNNASAAQHIRLITAKTGQKPLITKAPLERIDSIVTDILSLKKDLSRYDAASHEMEYLIRNLITENDALYVMLHKRSRELAELRSKFDGTPYAQNYDILMKALPTDRVPQRLHQSNELLALIREQTGISINVQANEVEALIQDVSRQKKALAPTSRNQLLAVTMESKRAALINRTLALLDKQENLSSLKAELMEMNASLKSIDAYYQEIKSGIAEKNFTEQKQFADLMIDYAAKLREIETLKALVEARDRNIAPAKEALAKKNTEIFRIDDTLAAKDKQIAEFKSLLAQKNALINKQKTDLDFTDKALDKTSAQIGEIETLLQENDRDLADLQAGVSRMRSLIQTEKPAAPVTPKAAQPTAKMKKVSLLTSELAQKDTQISEMKAAASKLSGQLADAQAALAEAQTALDTLTKENDQLKTTNNERAAFFNTLNAQLAGLSTRTENRDAALVDQQKALSSLTTQIEKLETATAVTRAELSERTRALSKTESHLRTLEAELIKTQSSTQRGQDSFFELQEANTAKSVEIARLKNEIDLLLSKMEELRGKIVISSPGQAHGTTPQEETNLLHQTLAKKDSEIVKLKEQLYSVITVKGNAAQCQDLDLQEKIAEAARLKTVLDEKIKIIEQTDAQSARLQEKIAVLEAKQEAIKSVVQKRDMECLELQKKLDKTKAKKK